MYGDEYVYSVQDQSVREIPVIFASSFLTFPPGRQQHRPNVKWLNSLATFLRPNGVWYNVFYVLLIVFFAYFYTQVTLNPTEIAANRENGGSIPASEQTRLKNICRESRNRLFFPVPVSAAIAFPIIQNLFGFPQSISMLMGGTSLLILVVVDLYTMSQIEEQLKMHHHEGLVKKGRIRSRNL